VIDFTLPELGENVTSGDVLRVLVNPGDTVARDQPVLELETDKATIEVPSSVAGTVRQVKVKAGDKVTVGQAILTVDGDGAAASAPEKPSKASKGRAAPPAASAHDAVGAKTAEQVPAEGGLEQHVEGRRSAGGVGEQADDRGGDQAVDRGSKVVDIGRGAVRMGGGAAAPDQPVAPASPSVRRMARELGVDINQVRGSGPEGRISVDDVKLHAKRIIGGTGAAPRAGGGAPAVPLPDFSKWGEIERQPMRAVRRKTAEHLSAAWATIPHVTQHDLADITALEETRARYAREVESAGGSLTLTAIAVKVVATALKVYPQFNASIDVAADEIIYRKYVNIGIAVDTDRGLLVPVIHHADTKNIVQIAAELVSLSDKARSRKIAAEEMQGGCFSISNLGSIGGSFFTPIVNAPEVAILGISRARMEPVYQKESGTFVPRLMLPLSLSYDHRVVDGADGIRFLRWVVEALERPFLLALRG
jgi:pyruvate dehydrogenase E2 component (dihydrolipoamide acetyltransferase)